MEAARAILQQRTAVFVAAQREATRYQELTDLSISTEQKQQRQAAESIHARCRKFGMEFAKWLRVRRPRPRDIWHLDEGVPQTHDQQ